MLESIASNNILNLVFCAYIGGGLLMGFMPSKRSENVNTSYRRTNYKKSTFVLFNNLRLFNRTYNDESKHYHKTINHNQIEDKNKLENTNNEFDNEFEVNANRIGSFMER